MINLDFYYFTFSTYILIIGIAFIISFVIFYNISKNDYKKIDIIYIYIVNIYGFALGAKLLSLIENNKEITILNFMNSGYSFIGGIIGSFLLVLLYCKRYKLSIENIVSRFIVIYPLIYSISKIGCFLNGCCGGVIIINSINYTLPIQVLDAIIMFGLFLILLQQFKKSKNLAIIIFLFAFGIIRFIEDYFRISRNLFIYNLTLNQIICIILIIIGLFTYFKTKQQLEKIRQDEGV